ncbi:Endothelin-converting enzyme 2, partial [Podila epigama]
DVVAFEKILAGVNADEKVKKANDGGIKASKNEEEVEEVEDSLKWDTFEDLSSMTPALDWKLIFKTAFPKDVAIPTQFDIDRSFNMTRLNKAVESSSPQTIQNYFVWTLIRNLGKNLAPSLQTPLQDINGGNLPRWKKCVNSVNSNIGELAGHFFVQQIIPAKPYRFINDMIKSVRWSFEKNILKYDWLDSKTRQNALQKLKAIVQSVGYSSVDPNVGSATAIDAHYKKLAIKANDHFGNHVRAGIWSTERKLRSVHDPVHRRKVDDVPQTVNAFYSPTQNSIEILAGILRSPAFSPEVPEYLNFGGIGTSIGHELGHAFDDSGRKYDEIGRHRN